MYFSQAFCINFRRIDAVASPIHLKLKYYNVHDELVTICANLFGTKRIHKALQCDQNNDMGKAMEINIASFIMQLRNM